MKSTQIRANTHTHTHIHSHQRTYKIHFVDYNWNHACVLACICTLRLYSMATLYIRSAQTSWIISNKISFVRWLYGSVYVNSPNSYTHLYKNRHLHKQIAYEWCKIWWKNAKDRPIFSCCCWFFFFFFICSFIVFHSHSICTMHSCCSCANYSNICSYIYIYIYTSHIKSIR